jgi:hypothetical protein
MTEFCVGRHKIHILGRKFCTRVYLPRTSAFYEVDFENFQTYAHTYAHVASKTWSAGRNIVRKTDLKVSVPRLGWVNLFYGRRQSDQIGQFFVFYLNCFNITEVAQMFSHFFHTISHVFSMTNLDFWATFWAIFSSTHPVTLVAEDWVFERFSFMSE